MSEPTTFLEVRRWAQGLGLPVKDRGLLPLGVIQRWNREHPDRPVSTRPMRFGPVGGFDGEQVLYASRGGRASAESRHESGGAR